MSVVKPKTNQLLDNIRLLSRGQTIEKPKPKLVTFSAQLKTTLSLV